MHVGPRPLHVRCGTVPGRLAELHQRVRRGADVSGQGPSSLLFSCRASTTEPEKDMGVVDLAVKILTPETSRIQI